jgi:hypothetical protein
MNFYTPKLMKIRWSSLFFGSFVTHFQIKLSKHCSNLNSIFVIMSELELFFFTEVLIQNFNTMDQGTFFWLQNTEGEPVVGGWLQIHQPQVLPPYFAPRKKISAMDLVKFLEKNQKLQIQIITVTLKVTSCRTIRKKKK